MKIMKCLPEQLNILNEYTDSIRELRLRENKAVYANIDSQWYYVGEDSLKTASRGAVVISKGDIDNILSLACDKSIYAYEDSLVNGYMTMSDGVRVGVAGQVSSSGDSVKCFSNYTSMCIRFPHHIMGCSRCVDTHVPISTLIIGQPGSGKTTFLRDLLCRLSARFNCVCIDDRGEITQCQMYDNHAINVDTLLYGDKTYAVDMAVRSLAPQCIITDEIVPKQYNSIKRAIESGVAVYASIHGCGIESSACLAENGIYFNQFVLLDDTQIATLHTNNAKCNIL